MKIHIVQKGDTLWEIAQNYGVDFEQLKQANSQLSSPDMIMPGMKIKIPSTTKSVKKEQPKKEVKIKHEKEMMPQVPKQTFPVIEGDEKEKKVEVKPEMPLPQMPTMEQEMNYYTMINLPQMPQATEKKQEKPKKQEVKKPKETIETKYQTVPEMPQHLHTPAQPQFKPEYNQPEHLHYTPPMMTMPAHMHPVCCYIVPPCYSMMPGHMDVGHVHDYLHHVPMPMHGQQDYGGDCGCTGGQLMMNEPYFDHYAPPYSGHYRGENEQSIQQSEVRAAEYYTPHPFESMNHDNQFNHSPSGPEQNPALFYPMPPSFREEDEE